MTDDELLSRRLQTLASAVNRHFIELVALHPRTTTELARHFDYPSAQLHFVGKQLCDLNFVTVIQKPERYDYDSLGLATVLEWIMRIQSIQAGTSHKNLS
jgi:hypothetical protein